ncbi:FAD-dependent monooxygenase [Microlunatus sp. GCM10028923]|uniref:FAD-dependent monooxygenase n=1 Tax=Microlunatus sp. GCM10028923 TaxID=3273400 RepID=UPI003616455A
MTAATADVIVVGAGPAGLMVAGDLAEAGVEVVLMERRAPAQSNLTRAFVVAPRTLEQFDARGIADDLVTTGSKLTEMRLYGRLRVDFSNLPSRYPYELLTPQFRTEAVLQARAVRAGVRFQWQTEVTGLSQDEDGVELHTTEGPWRARYVVGADGVRSSVRRALRLPFPGEVVLQSMILADVQFTDHPDAEMRADANRDGFVFHVPFGDGWYRLMVWNRNNEQPAHAPVALDEVRGMLHSMYGTDFGMTEARWTSRFQCDERQVAQYRVGRVFLAGDAAHTHTPSGGQGMNTSLQDAANLGWRLAAAIHDHGPAHVLDDYHRERHPVGRQVIASSGAMMRVAKTGSPIIRALRTARIGGISMHRAAPQHVADGLSGIGFDYPAPAGADSRIGNRVPDLELEDGSRLYEALRGGRFVMIKGSGGNGDAAAGFGWRGPVTEVATAQRPEADLLIRPDGHLAWAS